MKNKKCFKCVVLKPISIIKKDDTLKCSVCGAVEELETLGLGKRDEDGYVYNLAIKGK